MLTATGTIRASKYMGHSGQYVLEQAGTRVSRSVQVTPEVITEAAIQFGMHGWLIDKTALTLEQLNERRKKLVRKIPQDFWNVTNVEQSDKIYIRLYLFILRYCPEQEMYVLHRQDIFFYFLLRSHEV